LYTGTTAEILGFEIFLKKDILFFKFPWRQRLMKGKPLSKDCEREK